MFMRSSLLLGLILTVGCGPATAVLVDGDALDDTAVADDDSSDTGTDGPDGTDVDPDTVEPDTDAPIEYFWEGVRDFTFDFGPQGECEDTLVESGQDVTDDPDFAEARAACPECNYIFLVEMDKDSLCEGRGFQGFPVATPTLRAVGADGGARVFGARLDTPNEWFEFQDVDGGWGGFTYQYEGSARAFGFDVPFTVEASGAVQ
ncbi:MAG: hypothetical protein ACJAZO_000173 [Myxococcota bacterium]|jgi:hypothetical protein